MHPEPPHDHEQRRTRVLVAPEPGEVSTPTPSPFRPEAQFHGSPESTGHLGPAPGTVRQRGPDEHHTEAERQSGDQSSQSVNHGDLDPWRLDDGGRVEDVADLNDRGLSEPILLDLTLELRH